MSKGLAIICALALGTASVGAWAQVTDETPPADETTPPATDTGTAPPATEDGLDIPDTPTVLASNISGAEEVPPRDTPADGAILLQLSEDGAAIQYRLEVEDISNVVAAHLHLGRPGENGPIVVTLFGPAEPGGGPVEGVLSEGVITAADLEGPLAGTPIEVLIELLRGGAIYVNVHTNDGEEPVNSGPGDSPEGEIRGQIGVLPASAEACRLIAAQNGTGTEPTTPPAQ